MKRIVNVIYGKVILLKWMGYVSGMYIVDVFFYVLGWIIGVEWDFMVVFLINEKYKGMKDFKGQYIYIEKGNFFEIWFVQFMEKIIFYEQDKYDWQWFMSFINWVMMDLLIYLYEFFEDEDKVFVNFNLIYIIKKFELGLFVFYYIYLYYFDFLNYEFCYFVY